MEGARGVDEALDAGQLETLFYTDESHPVVRRAIARKVPTEPVTEEVMARLTSTVTPQGLVGIAPYRDVDLGSVAAAAGCLAVLSEVRDP
ncbi:MAG: RNA methyltransferase, partial [Actinomycetota bacterium]|nr:RNA methyltransferase [Actinomycetota bacterium]